MADNINKIATLENYEVAVQKKFNVNLKIVKSMLFDSFEQRRILIDSSEQHRFYIF